MEGHCVLGNSTALAAAGKSVTRARSLCTAAGGPAQNRVRCSSMRLETQELTLRKRNAVELRRYAKSCQAKVGLAFPDGGCWLHCVTAAS